MHRTVLCNKTSFIAQNPLKVQIYDVQHIVIYAAFIQLMARCDWAISRPCRPIPQCQSKHGGKQEGKVVPTSTPELIFFTFLKPSCCSQQSTVSFVVSQGPDRRLMDLGPDKLELDLGPDKLNTSSSDLEKLKTSSSELQTLKKSSSFDLEKFQKSSADLEKLDSKPRDLPSELCKLRKELELSDLKLVESSPQKLTSGQIDVYHCDPNSNCKSGENCAECVL